jgi:hypothetical protein
MDNIEIVIAVVTTILALANIFQWFDRRSKNKALESFLEAAHNMARRLASVSEKSAVQEKSADICAVLKAAIVTVSGRSGDRKFNILSEVGSKQDKKNK